MEIIEIEINKIKPDQNQPRTSIDEEYLGGMAHSIGQQGVINAIEVDKDLMIVTGEVRWRSAMKAELKTIPAKIIDISDEHRFVRQVIANIHSNTMSDWDTATALKKLLNTWPGYKSGEVTETGVDADEAIVWLSETIGKSSAYIREKVSFINELERSKRTRLMKKQLKNNHH